MNLDPKTSLVETEIVKILYLKRIANEILDGFNDAPRITRISINEAKNIPTEIKIPITNIPQVITLKTKRTRGLDKQPHKKKAITPTDFGIIFVEVSTKPIKPSSDDDISMQAISSPHAIENLEIIKNQNKFSTELFILYCAIHDVWDKPSIIIDEPFAYMIV